MCHATKEIIWDMQDDEYFESHYKVARAFTRVSDEEEINVHETLLYSKCQKDPLGTVSSVVVVVAVGRDGALVESIAFNRRVVGSTPALAVT